MTQPAAPGPFPRRTGDPYDRAQPLPDSLTLGPPTPAPSTPGPRRAPWWWWALIVASGIPVGLLWWVLAPSGLNLLSGDPALASGSNASAWLPRDLVLGGLFLFAGCITGTLVSGNNPEGPPVRSVVLAVTAAAAAALVAWGLGVLAGAWWGPVPDPAEHASAAFSLRSYQLLAVWPAAVAVTVFLSFAVRKPVPAPDTGA